MEDYQNDEELFNKRVELLKSYINRVSDGEEMENVQKEFKENFSDVPAKEIAKAEQTMMKDGMPFEKIQKLCDIHSVLFEDMTDEERMQRLKEEMQAHQQVNYIKTEESVENFDDESSQKCMEYINTTGHPLNVLVEENNAINELLNIINDDVCESPDINKIQLEKLFEVKNHYKKKDDLIFPLLKDKYDYPGPSDIMWAVEDEIMDELKNIYDDYDVEKLKKLLKRIEEMIYKEENVLYPLCAENFTSEEWIQIREDMNLYPSCLVESLASWDKTAESVREEISVSDDLITLPGGTFTLKQLRAMLNLIPMEITVIDENDVNRFFDEDDDKKFLRPKMALNRSVYSCHPPRVMKMVEGLIKQFKEGKRDSMHVVTKRGNQKELVNYYALRDEKGNYPGTMEAILLLNSLIDIIEKEKTGPVEF